MVHHFRGMAEKINIKNQLIHIVVGTKSISIHREPGIQLKRRSLGCRSVAFSSKGHKYFLDNFDSFTVFLLSRSASDHYLT